MRKLKTIFITLQAVILLTACAADGYEYEKRYQCYFYFDCSIHIGTVLQSCLSSISPGQFCFLWKDDVNNIRHVKMQLCDKQTKDEKITTDLETQRSCILGVDNGLIVGCSSLNDGQLYAFDRTCPNCLNNSLHKTLQWDNNGLYVKCPNCGRSYDLNNSGYVVSGDSGDKLMRYRASYTGSILLITN